MKSLIRVGTVSFRPEIREMLHRFIGGILKDIAVALPMSSEEALKNDCDFYAVYTKGSVYSELAQKIDMERLVAVELFPMPKGIKKVLSIPEGLRIGVIAGHLWCAAEFLAQLVECGAKNYYYTTGTPDTMASMKADKFVVPEELEPYIMDRKVKNDTIIVPRTLTSKSMSEVIKVAIRIQKELQSK